MRLVTLRHYFLILTALVLIGCGAPTSTAPTVAPTAPPTPAPPTTAPTVAPPTAIPATSVPTAAPPTAAAPTAAPTATASDVLPAPLYFIDQQRQIARLETDGKTITPIASEADPIFDFTVSAADGSLAYMTNAQGGQSTVVHIDAHGKGRVELLSGVLWSIAIPYSGESVEVGVIDRGKDANAASLEPGVWSFRLDGSKPTQIATNTPPTGSGDSITPGTRYAPIAWSPDSQKLLLRTSVNFGPDGPGGDIGTTGLALFERSSGEVRQLLPTSQEPLCIEPSWDQQSVAIYCATSFYAGDNTPALFRLSIAGDGQETLIPFKDGDQQNLVANVRELDDGLYSMVSTGPANTPDPKFTLQRSGQDAASGRVELLKEPLALDYSRALWARDGSGVALLSPPSGENRYLVWRPFDGSAPITLASGSFGDTLGWGKS